MRFEHGAPVPTDGPFAEAKESLAGYWIVDVRRGAGARDRLEDRRVHRRADRGAPGDRRAAGGSTRSEEGARHAEDHALSMVRPPGRGGREPLRRVFNARPGVAAKAKSKVVEVSRYGEAGPGTPGTAMIVTFELEGQEFTALNGGPSSRSPRPSRSWCIARTRRRSTTSGKRSRPTVARRACAAGSRTATGCPGRSSPSGLMELLGDPDPGRSQRAMQAMLADAEDRHRDVASGPPTPPRRRGRRVRERTRPHRGPAARARAAGPRRARAAARAVRRVRGRRAGGPARCAQQWPDEGVPDDPRRGS